MLQTGVLSRLLSAFCLVTVVKCSDVSLQLTGNSDFPSVDSDRLVMEAGVLVVRCRAYDSSGQQSVSDMMLSLSGLTPEVIISNSSWQTTLTFNNQSGSSPWELNLTRNDLGITDAWLPRESWSVRAELTTPDETLGGLTTLIDIDTVPLLVWNFGNAISSPASSVLDDVTATLVARSPCSADIALVVLQTSSPGSVLYMYTTYGCHAENTLQWFEVSSSVICGNACGSLKAWHVTVTNHHVILVTHAGIYISEDLRGTNSSVHGDILGWNAAFDFTGNDVVNATVDYTPHCLSREHDIYQGDVVTLTILLSNGSRNSFISNEPFVTWNAITEADMEVSSAAYNPHMHTVSLLVTNQTGNCTVHTRPLTNNTTPENVLYFPEFSLPGGACSSRLVFAPRTMMLYAVGQQVWLSSDNGNSFYQLSDLPGDPVVNVITTNNNDSMVITTDQGNLLFTFAGANRLAPLSSVVDSSVSRVNVDDQGHAYKVQLLAFNATSVYPNRTLLDLSAEVTASSVNVAHPLCLQVLSPRRAILYEYEGAGQGGDVPWFGLHHVGMILTPLHGGILRIRHIYSSPNLTQGFLSKMDVEILTSPQFLNTSHSSAMGCTLVIQDWIFSTGEASLHLSGCGGSWQASDVTKTVVIPGHLSFLLVNMVSGTEMSGVSVGRGSVTAAIPAGRWALLGLGVDSGQATWSVSEDRCRHEMVLSSSVVTRRQFELDLGDNMTFNASVKLDGYSPWFLEPTLYMTLSHAWLFYVSPVTIFAKDTLTHTLTVSLRNTVLRRGVTSIRLFIHHASMLCPMPSVTLTFYAGCPCRKAMVMVYPVSISDATFLDPSQGTMEEQEQLYDIEVNYRPPSKLGIDIPTNDHIYHADPSQPRRKNEFKISQRTGFYKQCLGKDSRSECDCTDEMKLSAHTRDSDCRERAYRLVHPGKLSPVFLFRQAERIDIILGDDYVITVTEVNDRAPAIQETGQRGLSQALKGDSHFPDAHNYFNPSVMELTMNGSGLYHYRARLVEGQSYCDLETDFQVYVDLTPIAYPLNYVLNFSMAIVIGGLLFVVYVWYMLNHHRHRVRRTGPLCKDIHDMVHEQGSYSFDQQLN